jgi:histidine ammonia-lyase
MIELDGHTLTIETARRVVFQGEPVAMSARALDAVAAAARLVEEVVREGRRVYGINTGFGKLSTEIIPREQLRELQINLLRSHAAGVGEPLPPEAARAALLFRLNALLQGRSGVRPVVIEYLTKFLNEGVTPVIPRQGSVGSSGDLAPLAHIALLLVGEGEAFLQGKRLSGTQVLQELDLRPLELAPKEGLALINGTQVSLAVGVCAFCSAKNLLEHAPLLAAMALEAAGGHTESLDERLYDSYGHRGPREIAERMRGLLLGSRLIDRTPDVQDPYSLRCAPQVLGSCVEALEFVRERLEAEMNAATDNPLLFPETGEVLSGGNFHGEGLALACEVLGLALAELGAFAERRIAYILEHPEFPPFLIEGSGLRSGLMLAQYTAASLVSENKILAHPAVVDSIPTSGGKEDYNSLASLASWKTFQITQNVEYILAIELLTVGQALSFLDVQAMAPKTRSAYGRLRQDIPPLTEDRFLGQDIKTARRLLQSEELIRGI